MFQSFLNIFRVPELRNKVLFTLFMLAIYRIGFWVPLPGVDQAQLTKIQQQHQTDTSAAGRIASYVSLFSGGTLGQSTVFGLGVMPYISASIIFQLLGTVVPQLEKLQKEGETGRKKIQEWTRYTTVPLCILQAIIWLGYMQRSNFVILPFLHAHGLAFWAGGVTLLTAGCIFLMWLGEQIDEYGLGNGVSLIILAGIVSRMPFAVRQLIAGIDLSRHAPPGAITLGKVFTLLALFIFIVMGSILITQAQRRIPVQQAKFTRGRRVYGGGKQFLPPAREPRRRHADHLRTVADAVPGHGVRLAGHDRFPGPQPVLHVPQWRVPAGVVHLRPDRAGDDLLLRLLLDDRAVPAQGDGHPAAGLRQLHPGASAGASGRPTTSKRS